jgi:hypothetical protein
MRLLVLLMAAALAAQAQSRSRDLIRIPAKPLKPDLFRVITVRGGLAPETENAPKLDFTERRGMAFTAPVLQRYWMIVVSFR